MDTVSKNVICHAPKGFNEDLRGCMINLCREGHLDIAVYNIPNKATAQQVLVVFLKDQSDYPESLSKDYKFDHCISRSGGTIQDMEKHINKSHFWTSSLYRKVIEL